MWSFLSSCCMWFQWSWFPPTGPTRRKGSRLSMVRAPRLCQGWHGDSPEASQIPSSTDMVCTTYMILHIIWYITWHVRIYIYYIYIYYLYIYRNTFSQWFVYVLFAELWFVWLTGVCQEMQHETLDVAVLVGPGREFSISVLSPAAIMFHKSESRSAVTSSFNGS